MLFTKVLKYTPYCSTTTAPTEVPCGPIVATMKLIIDEKDFYLFGRNPDHCNFTINRQCSRVHLNRIHLMAFGDFFLNVTEGLETMTACFFSFPAHGTFLGRIHLEPHKPQQVPIGSTMLFGGVGVVYTLREKTQLRATAGDNGVEDEELKGLLGLPEEEAKPNLTEFNTAHNKHTSTLTIKEGNLDLQRLKRKRRSSRVSFSEDKEIINPGICTQQSI
ncbi:LOW QUALITY PROTEIN: nuclear inhibitor of protein phosphatase 1 [Clarias gariepinus]